jgi:hypothetical protein
MNPIQKILISCSAAVEDVIERPQCRADAKRHAMVGAFVLLTAVFAFASGGFAVYTGFKSVPLAILVGIAWALMIFTIDRFIVSGIRKPDVSAMKFAERWKTYARELLITLPRIALACVISIVIVTPLELRFFEREIDARIAENQLADLHRATATIDTGFTRLQELQEKNKELREEIGKAQVQYQNANELKIQELAGISGTRHKGPGPVFQQRVEQADKLLNDWQTTEQKNTQLIRKNNSEIDLLEKKRESMIVARGGVIAMSDGFLARFEALGELAAAHPKTETARMFMTLLLLCIELTPVLTKMLVTRGAYDEIMDTVEHKVRVEQLKERSDLNDDAHADVILHSLRNQRRIAAEEELTRAMSDLDVLTQSAPVEYEEAKQRIAKITIQEWVRNQSGPRPHRIPIRTP